MRAKLQSDPTEKSRTPLRRAEKRYRGEAADFSDVLDFRFTERNTGVRAAALVERVSLRTPLDNAATCTHPERGALADGVREAAVVFASFDIPHIVSSKKT